MSDKRGSEMMLQKTRDASIGMYNDTTTVPGMVKISDDISVDQILKLIRGGITRTWTEE